MLSRMVCLLLSEMLSGLVLDNAPDEMLSRVVSSSFYTMCHLGIVLMDKMAIGAFFNHKHQYLVFW